MEVVITKSKKKDNKFDAIINAKNTISFGAVGFSDFTKHHDEKRKEHYIKRHSS